MVGHIELDIQISDYIDLNYKKATINQNLLEQYIQAGHSTEFMCFYNYFEPNPLPRSVEKIREHFSHMDHVSLAINFCRPGQYLPLHQDFYQKWSELNGIKNIEKIFRAVVMLEDGKPGQILQINDHCHTMWKQGDYMSWIGATPHAIYNFSQFDRYAVQVTGLMR